MLRKITLLFSLILVSCWTFAQDQSAVFCDYPSLSPDASQIVFTFDSDLWMVSAQGGEAKRITAMDGLESMAKISPDGKWIAFSNNQYGNNDIFIMPVGGGSLTQLTFHQSSDMVSTWSWDSQTIYFTSNRYNRISTYKVSIKGGTPQRLFPHYFNNVHNLAVHPNGEDVFFNESWESDNFANRKRYKGAFNPDIKQYNLKTGTYKQLTDYEGKDFWQILDKTGKLYFVSDEYNGEYNLYTLANDKKKRLTKFESSVKNPSISANGALIAFQKDYKLWTYNTKNGKAKALDIRLNKNNTLAKTKDFEVSGKITAFDVSPDGKKLSFISRGELFVSDIEGKFIKQMSTKPDERVADVYWLKDNLTLLYSQTVGGYQNWFTLAADGSASEKQLTFDPANNRNLSFNKDRTKAVYLSGRNEVRLMDLESMESELLCEKELWGFYNDVPHFTPDQKHIVFSAYENFERDIYICNIESKKVENLTNTGVTEASPMISPDGKYLYFTSNRTKPSFPFGLQDANMYRIALQAYDSEFRSDKYDALFEKKEEKKKEEKKDTTAKAEEKKEELQLELDRDGLWERVSTVGPRFGSQYGPYVIQKGDKTQLIYSSNHDEGSTSLWMTTLEPFEKPKTKKIAGTTGAGYLLVAAKNKYYTIARGNIVEVNLGAAKANPIKISHKFRRNLQNEFKQMFFETWANLEQNFYDENFHGLDWEATRDEYASYIPHINNRGDLRLLTNDMLGELNTSHFGFYSNGAEEKLYFGTTSLATGILFDNDKPYEVERIVSNTPASRKGKDIQKGDQLIAVNGLAIDPSKNREWYFSKPSLDQELSLTFKRGTEEKTVKLHPTYYFNVRNQLYNEWEKSCQKIVDKASNKKIAYIHMKNMGGGELNRFLQEMVSEGHHRDALILDLRWNTGGNVHDDVLRFLTQKPYLQWKYREGALTDQPNFGPSAKPIVLLTNEQSLSDAEMTAAGFKELGLGKIIGTETYRWIIFTTGQGLVDGSFYRLPTWGCYTLDGKNIEKTGVAPDIFVRETFKDRLDQKDPQLERAIKEIMGQMK